MRKIVAILLFASLCAFSQDEKKGSISGTVKDPGTGTPIEGVTVSVRTNARFSNGTILQSASTKEIKSTSDSSGHYRLSDLPPSTYQVTALTQDFSIYRSKMVMLREGQTLASIDFQIPAIAKISGRVLDQNKEPIPGATVYLIAKDHTIGGGIGYFIKNSATADDQGEYSLGRAEPGFP